MTKILKTTFLTLTAVIFSACPNFYSRAQGASAFSGNLKNTTWEIISPRATATTTTVSTDSSTENEDTTVTTTILTVEKTTLSFTNDSFTLTSNELFSDINGKEFKKENTANGTISSEVNVNFFNFFFAFNNVCKFAEVPDNQPTGRTNELTITGKFTMARNKAAEYIYTVTDLTRTEVGMETKAKFNQSGETYTYQDASGKKLTSTAVTPYELFLIPTAKDPSGDGEYKITSTGSKELLIINIDGDIWKLERVK